MLHVIFFYKKFSIAKLQKNNNNNNKEKILIKQRVNVGEKKNK